MKFTRILAIIFVAFLFMQTISCQKEEQKLTKEQKKAQKAEAKRLEQEAKLKAKEEQKKQEELAKEQERQAREQEKIKAEQEAETQKQARLEAEALSQCQPGQFKDLQGNCNSCSANCESCSSATHCNYCEVGFYRVIAEKKVNAYCSNTVPQGYLPQINKFYQMNPQITAQVDQGDAIAFDGKKPITTTIQQLPFTVQNGVPMAQGQKVRVDVVPCIKQCRVCPQGFLLNSQDRSCQPETGCQFPNFVEDSNGQRSCVMNDPSNFRGIINIKRKQASADASVPQPTVVGFEAQINRTDLIGVSYQWSIFNNLNEDISDVVLTKGKFGRKIKADLSAYQAGSTFSIKCLVRDQKEEQNAQGNLIETSYTL